MAVSVALPITCPPLSVDAPRPAPARLLPAPALLFVIGVPVSQTVELPSTSTLCVPASK